MKPFVGDPVALKWAVRDLRNLDSAISMVPERRVAVQAGGFAGVFPKHLAAKFGTVYTFEPDASLFAQLMKNAPERNIVKMQAAVGYERGTVGLSCSRRDNTGRRIHTGLTHVSGQGHVPVLRIDDLGLAVCDLIYLDIEGFELHALRGAVETIKRCQPILGVELNRNITFTGSSADELRAFLTDLGYQHALTVGSDEIFAPTR